MDEGFEEPLQQLRAMAKAIAFCEPATQRDLRLSGDKIRPGISANVFSKENPKLVKHIESLGPLRGPRSVFGYIDHADRGSIIEFVCSGKFRAWTWRPSRVGGPGSVEFRRPPGVVTAKKAKHWIAFAMPFLDMAVQFNPDSLAHDIEATSDIVDVLHPNFQDQLLCCTKNGGRMGDSYGTTPEDDKTCPSIQG
ncbi:hypothetical protein FQN57_004387 [Myotisia sp. PD_48]|nr:hypothetical protein FQN57_004387 [Myotisia sp. PD_48]